MPGGDRAGPSTPQRRRHSVHTYTNGDSSSVIADDAVPSDLSKSAPGYTAHAAALGLRGHQAQNLAALAQPSAEADGEAATDVRYNLPAWSDACLSHISVGRCQSILAVGYMSIHMSTHRYSLCAGRGATDSEGVVAAAGSDEQVAAHCRWPVVLALSGAAQL